MRLFGSDNIAGLMDRLGLDEDTPIEHPLITRSIETAQKRVENRNFEIRKHVLEYDNVMNQQRELIYSQRRRVLFGEDVLTFVHQMIEAVVERAVDTNCPDGGHPEEWDLKGLLEYAHNVFLPNHQLTPEDLADTGKKALVEFLVEKAKEYYKKREEELGGDQLRELERYVILRVVDEKWMDHLDAMDQLREGIGLRAYGQKDPLVEYKIESVEMFNNMIAAIQEDVVRYLMRLSVVRQPETRRVRRVVENRYQEEGPKKPYRREQKIGRNDPCPCGSGKKYKKCCGRNG
jgi:preprotein translocase subunit SecA